MAVAHPLFAGLNERQLEAVRNTLDVPTLVIAGAGSGKTSVLTRRTAYLLEQGVNPFNILVVTFTVKAANEMKERIEQLVGAEKTKQLTIGTFHSVAVRMLRRHGHVIGIPKNFTIYDTEDQRQLLRDILKRFRLPTDNKTVVAYHTFISQCKNQLLSPEACKEKYKEDPKKYVAVYQAYQEALAARQALDFDDLIFKAVRMLGVKSIRNYYQKRYRYVAVDEYQDTNPAQYEMIKRIVGDKNNLFVVGDDWQAIYGFRGSDIRIILNFERDFPNCKVVKLEQNYRSTKTVVRAGNELMKHNIDQKQKTLFTENPEGTKIVVRHFPTGEAEAEYVAEQVAALLEQGYQPKDIAILYRMNFLSRQMEHALRDRKIPYHIVGGVGFYERMEIKDTLAFLRVLVNPNDDLAVKRILGLWPNIGKQTIQKLERHAEEKGCSLYDALSSCPVSRKAIRDSLDALRMLLDELKNSVTKERPVSIMLHTIWRKTGYRDALREEGEEGAERLKNLDELMALAIRYEDETEHPTLEGFLEEIQLAPEGEDEEVNAVQLMTIHASKGLEFSVVFCIGWEEGVFPSSRAFTPDQVAEERRLAYVAITRAKERLFITGAEERLNQMDNKPSRFIQELPQEILDIEEDFT